MSSRIRSLVFQIAESSTVQSLVASQESGTRAVKIPVPPSGTLILTTLSAPDLSKPSDDTKVILQACDIEIPDQPRDEIPSTAKDESTTPSAQRKVWTSAPPHLLKPTRPLPQLMLVNPDLERESLGWDTWTVKALGASQAQDLESANGQSARIVLEDINDTLLVEQLGDDPRAASQIMDTARSDAQTSTATEFPREKQILCPRTVKDALSAMPLFQADAYFSELVRLGRANGQRRRKGVPGREDGWNIGDVVLYGEAVTSTQTMLDKLSPSDTAPACGIRPDE